MTNEALTHLHGIGNASVMNEHPAPLVLVIDDEPAFLDGISALLERHGFRTKTAVTVPLAQRLLEEETPSIVITDLQMPGTDGIAFARWFRIRSEWKQVPLIFLSGYVTHDQLNPIASIGADVILTKPVTGQDLLQVLREQVARRTAAVEEADRSSTMLRQALTRGLPHDLNSSLQVISGFMSILEDEGSVMDPMTRQEYVHRVAGATRKLRNSVERLWLILELENILALKRAGRCLIEDRIPMRSAFAAYATTWTSRYPDRVHSHIVENADEIQLACPDRFFSAVLQELIMNAVQHSFPNAPVTVSATIEGEIAWFEVAAKGRPLSAVPIHGIAGLMEFQMDRFARRGTGLGLAIVQRVMEICDGWFDAEGTSDDRSVIRVGFPISRREEVVPLGMIVSTL